MKNTPEAIKERIDQLTTEKEVLEAQHNKLLTDHQQRTAMVQQAASSNLNRMQQIVGGIAQLTELLNGEKPPTESKPK